jgi:8-oxo-dGTP diphosphatase
MNWTPKTPYLATDGIIEVYDKDNTFLGIVLIERKNEPTGLAIPGGFVDIGESTENAAIREMKEETTLDVKVTKLLGVYSEPSRDKRFHVVSTVYICSAIGVPKGNDDAKEASIYKIDKIPMDKLVFDHKNIIEDYLKQLK